MTTERRVHFYDGLMIDKGASMPAAAIPALTDGQLAIGKSGYPPVPGSITGGGGIVVTGGAGTLALTTRGYVTTTTVGNVGAGEDVLATWAMPANTLVANSGFHALGEVLFANNGNTKTLKFHVGGSSFLLNTTAAPGNQVFLFDVRVFFFSTTVVRYIGTCTLSGIPQLETGMTLDRMPLGALNTSIDLTTTTTVKVTGEGTATDDVQLLALAILAFRTP